MLIGLRADLMLICTDLVCEVAKCVPRVGIEPVCFAHAGCGFYARRARLLGGNRTRGEMTPIFGVAD